MKKNKIILIIFFILLFYFSAFSQGLDIDEQSRKLASVETSIKQKEKEKDKFVKDEKTFKREVADLDKLINEAEKKLKSILQDISVAQKKMSEASKDYDNALEQKDILNKTIDEEVLIFNKMSAKQSYEKNPIEYKIRQIGIEQKQRSFDDENKKAVVYSKEMTKWEKDRDNLLKLRAKESAVIEERKKLIEEKNRLLKSASSKRKQTEEEIKKLNEDAKVLQSVVDKLILESKKRKESEELEKKRKEAELKTKPSIAPPRPQTISPASKKKQTPREDLMWPVNGSVILHFGRNHHPELNTFIVNNGIKIRAQSSAQVKSVASGTVVFTGQISSYGKVVIIEHGSFFAVYGQLSDILIKNGARVKKGDIIGRLGTGNNNVLYFEIRKDDVPDNPMLWLR
ncbi:MAG: peptidoglycan DD-metalloendopeptidase family protein [Elusimicrobiota bacterium]|jgi:septal ring factor EnvC (AmiA/AmiB activator)|nr:peptidoglycan DD-metalloendopeptidase family protein [Elusimicrobiota bacterium]